MHSVEEEQSAIGRDGQVKGCRRGREGIARSRQEATNSDQIKPMQDGEAEKRNVKIVSTSQTLL